MAANSKQIAYDLKKLNDAVYVAYKGDDGGLGSQIVLVHGLQVDKKESVSAIYENWLNEDDSDLSPISWVLESFPAAAIFLVHYDSYPWKDATKGRMDMVAFGEYLLQCLLLAGIGQSPVNPVVMVGLDVGGLVIEQICLQAARRGDLEVDQRSFLESLKAIFYVSTPHYGPHSWDRGYDGELMKSLKVINPELSRSNEAFRKLRHKYKWITYGSSASQMEEIEVKEGPGRYDVDTYRPINASPMNICTPTDRDRSIFLLVHLAASKGNDKVLDALLDLKTDLNVKDTKGKTALNVYSGSRGGSVQIVKKFLEHGADPRIADQDGRNCLHVATYADNCPVLRSLLDHEVYSSRLEVLVDINVQDSGGHTALHLAMKRGRHDVIEEILDRKPEVNIQDEWGMTALHMYAIHGKESAEVVKKLLHLGVDPRIVNSDKRNCLHVAVRKGNAEFVKCLLEMDVALKDEVISGFLGHEMSGSLEKRRFVNAVDEGGSTALHLAGSTNTHDAFDYCLRQEIVDRLLEHGADPRILDKRGRTVLHVAAFKLNADAVRSLLKHNVFDINAVDEGGSTALHLAASTNTHRRIDQDLRQEIVDRLLQRGADPRILDKQGRTVLHAAAFKLNADAVRSLLKHNVFDINAVDEDGSTALHLAASTNTHRLIDQDLIVDRLLEHGADPRILDKRGQTVLHVAAFKLNAHAVRSLLKHNVFDINAVDEGGSTALHLAASTITHRLIDQIRRQKIVDRLLQRGADPRILDKQGRTVLHAAAFNLNADVVRNLLKHNVFDINAVDEDGSTALHLAASTNTHRLIDQDLIVDRLLEHGADPRILDKRGQTVLHVAAFKLNAHAVRSLLKHNVFDINAVDEGGSTALHLAASTITHRLIDQYRRQKIVDRLLQRGADPRILDKQGRTVLHAAAFNLNADAVRNLLEHNVFDINAVDEEGSTDEKGSTVLHFAASGGRSLRVMGKFVDHGAQLDHIKGRRIKNQDLLVRREGSKSHGWQAVEVQALDMYQEVDKDTEFKGEEDSTSLEMEAEATHHGEPEELRRSNVYNPIMEKKSPTGRRPREAVEKNEPVHDPEKCSSNDSRSVLSERSLRLDASAFGFRRFDEPFDSTRILVLLMQSESPRDDAEDDGGVEIVFLHHEGMALLFGVGFQFSKVALRPNCEIIQVYEVGEMKWTRLWMPSESQTGSLALLDAVNMSISTTVHHSTEGAAQAAEFNVAQEDEKYSTLAVNTQQFPIFYQHENSLLRFVFGNRCVTASGGSTGGTSSETLGTEMNNDGQLDTVHDILKEDATKPDGESEQERHVTVRIHLNPGDFTLEPPKGDEDTRKLSEKLMEPVITITFFKVLDGVQIIKRFNTVVNTNFFMNRDVDDLEEDPERFGWYHDYLRLSFKCEESNAVTIGKRNVNHEERDFQRLQGLDTSDKTSTTKKLDGKVRVGNKHVAAGELASGVIHEATTDTTKRQEDTSTTKHSCVKDTNFVIADEGGPVELACLAHVLDGYNLWNPDDREKGAMISGRMSNVPILAEGHWSIVNNSNAAERICEYRFTCGRSFIMMKKREAKKPKKLLKFLWRKKKVRTLDDRELKFKQKIDKTFVIDHSFSHLEGLKGCKARIWHVAQNAQAPNPICDIINIAGPSSPLIL